MGSAAAVGLLIVKPQQVRGSAANSAVRLGLLGCGGRGTTVARSFATNTGARVVALADLCPDRLEAAKKQFDAIDASKAMPPSTAVSCSAGPRRTKRLSPQTTSTWSRFPRRITSIRSIWRPRVGKHIYCEKPVAVDVAGAKRVLRARALPATGTSNLEASSAAMRSIAPHTLKKILRRYSQ